MYKQVRYNTKKRRRILNKPWFNTSCKNSKNQYNRFKNSLPCKPSELHKAKLKDLTKKHKKLLKKEKRKHDKELNAKLKYLKSSNPGEYWNIINRGKRGTRSGKIPDKIIYEHFSELNKAKSNPNNNSVVKQPQNANNNDIINIPFTEGEITDHIKSLKNNKSPGVDHILNEFLKFCPKELIVVIVQFFNIILDSGKIPNEWTIGLIKPLYKNKGDINDINNYRGITLLSCIGKLFTSVLNTRLYSYLTSEDILGNEQAGFRPQHSTLDHIFALHILSKFYIDQKKQLFCAFVDYSKAFDFIDRVHLWTKLLASNVNGKVFNIIRNMYENAKSQVLFKNTLSDPFPCQVGVRQGENLSPLLFAIYLNDFNLFLSTKYNGLTKITESVSNELQIYLRIFCLLYADDTLVLAESAKELQKALNSLHAYCNKWALNVNIDKTKIIIFSKGRIRKYKSFSFGNNEIDVVDDYIYLGTTFNYNGTFHKAKTKQASQAMRATYSLITNIKRLNLSIETSIELFDRLIIPVLLYGSEIWGFESPKQLQTKYNNVMRKFLHLHKTTSMVMVNGELGLKEISEYIENRMLNFWYNVATGDENKISTILYKWINILYFQDKYKSAWFDKINLSLSTINMSDCFYNTASLSKVWFKNTIKVKFNEVYAQRWAESVFNNSACINYRAMTIV